MNAAWWQGGVIYQIYPRSFQDTNGDGIGDLPGISARLDYCASLGVDALWLSPIYPSPMADFGYDISNFVDIHPLFGTLEDFDVLLMQIKQRGMRLILDYVPNHTSSEHPWFKESKSSRNSAKRDWYLWRNPAADGGPPNNWLSNFGGSAWQRDEATQQYYYHAFLKEQPDLNWRNPEVVAAMHDVLRFWMRRGVDGFRVDVLWLLIKDDQFRDNPRNLDYHPGMAPHLVQTPLYTADRPEALDVLRALRRVMDEFDDRVLIGEVYLPLNRLIAYYGHDLDGANLPFNFQLLQSAWDARSVRAIIDRYESALPKGAWPNWVLGNHDNPRIASRVGLAQARVAAMLLLTLRGTPTLYYGDEIAMFDVAVSADRIQDPFEKNVPGHGLGRDPCRTPMQWDGSSYAGFSSHEPWLPLSDDYPTVNVQAQASNPNSHLRLYQQLLHLRKSHPALAIGRYQPLVVAGDLVAYMRHVEGERLMVALNLANHPCTLSLESFGYSARILLSTHLDRQDEAVAISVALRPNEGLIAVLATATEATR